MSLLEHLSRVSSDGGSDAKYAEISTGSRGSLSISPFATISGSQIRAAPISRHRFASLLAFLAWTKPLNHSSRTRSADSCASPDTLALAASSVRAWMRNSKRALKRSARRMRR